MKKLWIAVMALVLCACSTSPSMKKSDVILPSGWKAAVTLTDYQTKTGRLVFFDEKGVLGSAASDITLVDEEHPLPQTEKTIWIVPGFTDKEIKPGKTLCEINKETSEMRLLHTEPSRFTAASESALYFSNTDPGTPPIVTLDKLDLETMKKTSLELEGIQVRGLCATEKGVCLLSVKEGTELTAMFFNPDLTERSSSVLLNDTVGNVFWCMAAEKMIVFVWHMDGEVPKRTMFVIDPDNASWSQIEFPFSPEGRPFSQDNNHIILIEYMNRNDVLISRCDIESGTYDEYVFDGTFMSLAADDMYIYLLDQNQTIHIFDSADPSIEINSFEIEHNSNEYCRTLFSRY